jgi:signal transduction histidine kinase
MRHLLHPVVWLRTHPRVADGLLALLIVAIAVPGHLVGPGSESDPNQIDPAWWTVLIVVAGTAAVYWRRTHPLASGIFVVATEVIALFLGIGGAEFIGAVVAVYSIGAHSVGVGRTRVMGAIAVMVAVLFVVGWLDGQSLLDEFVSTGVLLITAFVIGDNLRRRRQQHASLAERAERAERERDLLAEQRVTAERTRIARDLHDVVAHSVSVMVIQAAAARRSLADSPELAAEALETIESTGRQTMNELRSILGVLRTDGDAPGSTRTPQPSLAKLDDLAGIDDLPVELMITGDVTAIPDSVSVTGFRLIQEALTNVRRHAGSVEQVSIVLVVADDDVTIDVVDDGRGAGSLQAADGFGIVGMRERVAAVGGTVSAGPRAGGGWRVRATLPIEVGSHHRPAASVVS